MIKRLYIMLKMAKRNFELHYLVRRRSKKWWRTLHRIFLECRLFIVSYSLCLNACNSIYCEQKCEKASYRLRFIAKYVYKFFNFKQPYKKVHINSIKIVMTFLYDYGKSWPLEEQFNDNLLLRNSLFYEDEF